MRQTNVEFSKVGISGSGRMVSARGYQRAPLALRRQPLPACVGFGRGRSGDSPLRRVHNSTGDSPRQPLFQIFFAAACDLDKPHFRRSETDSKMPYTRYNEGTDTRLPLMFTNTDHLFTHTVSELRCKLFVKCVTFS